MACFQLSLGSTVLQMLVGTRITATGETPHRSSSAWRLLDPVMVFRVPLHSTPWVQDWFAPVVSLYWCFFHFLLFFSVPMLFHVRRCQLPFVTTHVSFIWFFFLDLYVTETKNFHSIWKPPSQACMSTVRKKNLHLSSETHRAFPAGKALLAVWQTLLTVLFLLPHQPIATHLMF